jgi:hypothetical protein
MFTAPRSSVNPQFEKMQPPLHLPSVGDGPQERWRRASKSSAVAAAETFNESI